MNVCNRIARHARSYYQWRFDKNGWQRFSQVTRKNTINFFTAPHLLITKQNNNMKKYVITLLGVRKNEKQDIMPRLRYDGYNENIEHKTLGVLSNVNDALAQIDKLAKYLEEDLHEKVTIKTTREGDKVKAEIYSFCSDESQNQYVTQVFLTTIVEDEDIYVDDLFYQL